MQILLRVCMRIGLEGLAKKSESVRVASAHVTHLRQLVFVCNPPNIGLVALNSNCGKLTVRTWSITF